MKGFLEMIEELSGPSVKIKDPQRVEKLISQLINGSAEKLQVIADFDMTLSRFHTNGQRMPSCHGIIEESSTMPDFFRDEFCALKSKYYPIELDGNIPLSEKIPLMLEWYQRGHELIIRTGIHKDDIQRMVKESIVTLRDGVVWMLEQLDLHSVPLLVFSAGLGDIIAEIVRQRAKFHDNMKIVSNYMKFNEEGQVVGFHGDLLHMYNKNENAVHNSDYFERLAHRHNVILLGDSLGDVHMAEGVDNPQAVLKIGFLNVNIEERLAKYMDSFDIVLVDDQTMDVANALLKRII